MKTYLFLAGCVISAMLVACGSKSSDPAPAISCPAGSTFQNGYCVGADGRPLNTGSTGFYSENHTTGTLTPTGNGLKSFLKNAMGVCGRPQETSTYNDCNQWTSGAFDVVMQAPNPQSNTVQITFRAKPRPSNGPQYSFTYPTGGQFLGALIGMPIYRPETAVRNPLQLNMNVSVTNNYQGFEASGYGDFYTKANRSLIQIQIAQGKLEDGGFDYRIAYRGEVIITGHFVRCSSADCHLSIPL